MHAYRQAHVGSRLHILHVCIQIKKTSHGHKPCNSCRRSLNRGGIGKSEPIFTARVVSLVPTYQSRSVKYDNVNLHYF